MKAKYATVLLSLSFPLLVSAEPSFLSSFLVDHVVGNSTESAVINGMREGNATYSETGESGGPGVLGDIIRYHAVGGGALGTFFVQQSHRAYRDGVRRQ